MAGNDDARARKALLCEDSDDEDYEAMSSDSGRLCGNSHNSWNNGACHRLLT